MKQKGKNGKGRKNPFSLAEEERESILRDDPGEGCGFWDKNLCFTPTAVAAKEEFREGNCTSVLQTHQ
jgi:hypothetical protein